ncbi:RNHCP domain-containing protein [Geomicrobium sp. JCM 19038]|uniref:RNHCP domain-containing protein n=1 Tax=Geomicrobium sp. JCM 19038 TaxID=1460635 RepID=UPI001EE65AEE|nr:RNHCP domain-containing protein [Geomicrobium sp. JCM 19038]
MSRATENTQFTCEHCGMVVEPLENGSYRNHCPSCLYSKHVDVIPGDRASTCRSLMEPIDLKSHSKKGFQLLHRCLACGHEQYNKIAENTAQSDDIIAFMRTRSRD